MKSSKKMAAVITRIATRHGLNIQQIGANLRLENPPYMPLCIEVVGVHLLSIAHYGEQNGDAMADPEMVFWTDTIDGSWIPVSFSNDYVGSSRRATVVVGERISHVYPREQADQALFANTWAQNLREQGFLDVPPDPSP